MGRRKRKKITYRRVKTLPKIFKCPRCGSRTMKTKNRTKTIEETVAECPKCSYSTEIDAKEKKNFVVCPNCGADLRYKITPKEVRFSIIRCGTCGTEEEVLADGLTEPVDAFGRYIDVFYAEQEYERLSNLAKVLDRKGEWGELANVYSYLAHICKMNMKSALKRYGETQEPSDIDAAERWRQSSEEFKRREKDILERIELKELEEGDSTISEEDLDKELEGLNLTDKGDEKHPGNDIFT